MKYFTMDNTDGFEQDQLNKFNDEFPGYAKKNGFDISDEDDLKNAIDRFHNEVMIHG